jgi:hypothetical protein
VTWVIAGRPGLADAVGHGIEPDDALDLGNLATATYTRSMDMRNIYWALLAPFGFVIFTLGLLSIGGG